MGLFGIDIGGLMKDGIELVGKVLGGFRDEPQPVRETRVEVQVINPSVLRSIEHISVKLDALAGDITASVGQKLDSQELEKLAGHVKGAKLALALDNKELLSATVSHLNGVVEYARMRVAEGKREWFGPWSIGEAVRLASLRTMARSEEAQKVIAQEARAFRLNILNYSRAALLEGQEVPWDEIADFVHGKGETLLSLMTPELPKVPVARLVDVLLHPEPGASVVSESGETVSKVADVGSLVKKGEPIVWFKERYSGGGGFFGALSLFSCRPVVAPEDGRVVAVHVSVGKVVKRGQKAVTMEI